MATKREIEDAISRYSDLTRKEFLRTFNIDQKVLGVLAGQTKKSIEEERKEFEAWYQTCKIPLVELQYWDVWKAARRITE